MKVSALRASSYNIYTPVLQKKFGVLIQGYSGAVDKVDIAVLESLQNDSPDDLDPSTVKQLVTRGYLTSKSVSEEQALVKKISTLLNQSSQKTTGFIIAPTLGCQLRCSYCYEKPVIRENVEEKRQTMTKAHVDSMFKAITGLTKKYRKHEKTITLYGGEPLMAENHELVKYILEKGNSLGFSFFAVTNGVDLPHYEDLLGKDKIRSMQVTLDGPEEVHDNRRYGVKKSKSFQQVCNGIDLALKKGCSVSVRSNVDSNNIEKLEELHRFYVSQGWYKYEFFRPYAHPTHTATATKKRVTPMSLQKTIEGLGEKILPNMLSTGFASLGVFKSLLFSNAKFPGLKANPCGAHRNTYIFAADGNIYSCWDELGVQERKTGFYHPDFNLGEERLKEWEGRDAASIPECLECEYIFLCAGGCAHQAELASGKLNAPHCFEFKETFQAKAPDLFLEAEHLLEKKQEKKGKSCSCKETKGAKKGFIEAGSQAC